MSLIQTETPPNPLHKCEAGPIERQLYRQSKEAKDRLFRIDKTPTAPPGRVISPKPLLGPLATETEPQAVACFGLHTVYLKGSVTYSFSNTYDDFEQPRLQIKLVDIAREIRQREEVTISQLRGQVRVVHIAQSRHLFCYLAYALSEFSFTEIARWLGDRDHATIMHSVDWVKNRCETDKRIKEKVNKYVRVLTRKHQTRE